MAIKISQLTSLSELRDQTLIPVVDTLGTFTSKKISGQTLRGFFSNIASSGDSANLTINSDLTPAISNSDLGSSSHPFANVYLSGTISTGKIVIQSNVASDSVGTGALIVQGGAGINGAVRSQSIYAENYYYSNGAAFTGGSEYTVSNVAPVNPRVRDQWYDTDSNTIFTYIDDGASQQWVDIMSPATLNQTQALTITGNVTADRFIGNGALLTGIQATTVGTLSALNVTGNISANTISSTNIVGQLLSPVQTNITAVGQLGGLAVTGNVTAGNVTANYFTGNGALLTSIQATSVGTLASLAVTGNVTAGNVTAGNVTAGNVTAGNVTAGNVSASYFTGNGALLTGIQATTVGTLSSLTVSGAITVNSTNNATAIINGGTNGAGNIGSSAQTFNTVFARATTAQYADLAEKYTSDDQYPPGTVVVFGGAYEVTIATANHDPRVAGVVTSNPAYLMNDSIDGISVALTGKVPCWCEGPINKGDRLVSGDVPGTAKRMNLVNYTPGCIIGKSLENVAESEIKLAQIAVGRF
jgi:hypothetical protein